MNEFHFLMLGFCIACMIACAVKATDLYHKELKEIEKQLKEVIDARKNTENNKRST